MSPVFIPDLRQEIKGLSIPTGLEQICSGTEFRRTDRRGLLPYCSVCRRKFAATLKCRL